MIDRARNVANPSLFTSSKLFTIPAAPFRIIHTEWSDGWGGQEHRIVSEMLYMKQRGHQVLLVTRQGARIAEHAKTSGIAVRLLPFKGKTDVSTILPLRRWIRDEDYQIVNTHSGIDSWIGMFATRAGKAKLVRTRHLNIPLKRHLTNFVHYFYDGVITCGEIMRDRLIVESGFSPELLVSIPTCVDFDAFQPARRRLDVRTELGIPAHSFVVLMVGIVRNVKRYDLALATFARFQAGWHDAHLVIAGDGPKLLECQKLADELRIRKHVSFLGFRNDVPDLMNAADVLLMTSQSEGVPQAVTQALGLGLPVVATEVGGIPELIKNEETGLLVSSGNRNGLSTALSRIAHDRTLGRELGRRGQTHVRRCFGIDRMCNATELFYRRILKEGEK